MAFYTRKTPRLQNFDYASENFYFVTICTAGKKCIFGEPGRLNQLGEIAWADMKAISNYYENINVETFIIMPNHVHAIVEITGTTADKKRKSLDTIIGLYKSGVSRKIHAIYPNLEVWQRSVHDHVIRGQQQYEKIWNYVSYNDSKWESDCFYVQETPHY